MCGADERSWSVTLAVDADDAPQACARGSALILGLAVKAGLPDWPLVHIEAVRGDVLDAEHARPYIPPLASGPAAAEILGVCRQRVYQLADHPDFPEPLYELGAGKLWHRTATERFTAEWERRPGRPPHIRPESMGE